MLQGEQHEHGRGGLSCLPDIPDKGVIFQELKMTGVSFGREAK